MKTKEEIEQLAEKEYGEYAGYHKASFTNGYTQCQQDMVEKYTEQDMIKFAFDTYYQEDMAKKYTEEDIRKAIMVGIEFESGDYPEGFNYKLGMSIEDYFIESLNKQD